MRRVAGGCARRGLVRGTTCSPPRPTAPTASKRRRRRRRRQGLRFLLSRSCERRREAPRRGEGPFSAREIHQCLPSEPGGGRGESREGGGGRRRRRRRRRGSRRRRSSGDDDDDNNDDDSGSCSDDEVRARKGLAPSPDPAAPRPHRAPFRSRRSGEARGPPLLFFVSSLCRLGWDGADADGGGR